jgi:hypothetical protein
LSQCNGGCRVECGQSNDILRAIGSHWSVPFLAYYVLPALRLKEYWMRKGWMQDGIAVLGRGARQRVAALHLDATIARLHWRWREVVMQELTLGIVRLRVVCSGVEMRHCELRCRWFRCWRRRKRRHPLRVTERVREGMTVDVAGARAKTRRKATTCWFP